MPAIELAETLAADSQLIDNKIAMAQGITLQPPFAMVRSIVESGPAPRRPNRNVPIHKVDVDAEQQAWEAASDEAWDLID